MSNFITRQIYVTKIQHGIQGLIHSIDTPKSEEIKIFNSSMIKISGWVLYDNKPAEVVLQFNGHETIHTCEVIRKDVISLLKKNADEKCGFIIPVSHPVDFKIGFIINGSTVWVASVKIKPASKLLLGTDGYLFLDNDTNKSVEQFTGHTLMSEECLSLWGEYFRKIDLNCKGKKSKYIFALAPAKELVYPQLYPYKKSTITPVEQFLVTLAKFNILYPLNELRNVGDAAYWKLDTHWTDYGAGVVVNKILELFSKEPKNPFPFPFNIKRLNGDLGSKLPQITTQDILIADFSSSKKLKVFDNKIINRGWIQVYENAHSPRKEKVVVFGDSFSVNMVPYLVSVFNKVIHVLSGARIDYDIIENESPDYIVCEITTRFLIQSPDLNYSVSDDCSRKISGMSEKEKKNYIKEITDNTGEDYQFYLMKTISNVVPEDTK